MLVYEYDTNRLTPVIMFCSDTVHRKTEFSLYRALILVDSKEKLQKIKQDILSNDYLKEILSDNACTIQVKTSSYGFNIVFCPTGSELRVVYTEFPSHGRKANMILYDFDRCDLQTKRIIESLWIPYTPRIK